VTALGTIFDNISLSKVVTFKAFNGLPGVTISNFKLPSDDPAGGIHIETDASIPSPARESPQAFLAYVILHLIIEPCSEIGIDLGTVTFQSSFQGTVIGREYRR
jgi:hypothetical protein